MSNIVFGHPVTNFRRCGEASLADLDKIKGAAMPMLMAELISGPEKAKATYEATRLGPNEMAYEYPFGALWEQAVRSRVTETALYVVTSVTLPNGDCSSPFIENDGVECIDTHVFSDANAVIECVMSDARTIGSPRENDLTPDELGMDEFMRVNYERDGIKVVADFADGIGIGMGVRDSLVCCITTPVSKICYYLYICPKV